MVLRFLWPCGSGDGIAEALVGADEAMTLHLLSLDDRRRRWFDRPSTMRAWAPEASLDSMSNAAEEHSLKD